jgi:hypothetical protein
MFALHRSRFRFNVEIHIPSESVPVAETFRLIAHSQKERVALKEIFFNVSKAKYPNRQALKSEL